MGGTNSNNLRNVDDTTLMSESKENLKNVLMRVKEESKRASFKQNIKKTKIMASGPITSYQIRGSKGGSSDRCPLRGLQNVDRDGSHEIRRRLFPGRKAMTKLDSVLKSRDFTLPTTVHIVEVMAFPVIIHGFENWAIKKAESHRIDAFKLWHCRRLPWTVKRTKAGNLKGNQP